MWWYITAEWSYDVVYGINVYMRAETATGPSAINEAKYVGNWSQTLGQRLTANITPEYWHRCLDLRSVRQRSVLQWDTDEDRPDKIAARYATYAREVFSQMRLSHPSVLEVFVRNSGGQCSKLISYKGKGKGSILRSEYTRAQKIHLVRKVSKGATSALIISGGNSHVWRNRGRPSRISPLGRISPEDETQTCCECG